MREALEYYLMRLKNSHLHWLWDLLIASSVAFVAVERPARFVLGYDVHAGLASADWVITSVLFVDMLLHMRHPVSISKVTPRSPAAGASSRVWWFMIDLLAAIPFRIFPGTMLLQLLQVVKLARIAQFMRQWQQNEVQHVNILRLGFFAFWLLLTAHWLACGWLALGGINMEADRFTRYLRALYWCITTLATVGYGDITPSTNAQVVYAMTVMLLGVGMYGYVIGNVTRLLTNIDLAKNHYRDTMERLTAFMRYRHLPPTLQRRIRDYYVYLWENRLGYDESAVLAELPDSLRTEVTLFLRCDLLERAPLFQGASHEFIREVALELRPTVMTPGDYIFRAGQSALHMYFISRGTVEIISADGKTLLNTLTDGDFFGEIALLFSQPRTASVRAVDYCDLYTLEKETFDRVLTRYPDFAAHIHSRAHSRVERR